MSSVTDMSDMFYEASAFNQDIGDWNVSSVTDIQWMFYELVPSTKPIGDWNVSSVTYYGGYVLWKLVPSTKT